ncbi:MAG: universal stress protein [Burkholderiaceae bacterium]|nr:universal stress protein [Burkholderiaceae bacterium]
MYERILVPVDGSRFSEEVLPYAQSIARSTGAKLALMRVQERESGDDDAARQLQGLADALKAEVRTVPGRGNVAAAILEEAARVPGTLVAMTTHGRSGLAEAILGSVAHDVVRTGRDPVLVFRPRGRQAQDLQGPAEINTVMLPIDGSGLSEWMQQQAGEWARALKARLLVVQVISPDARPDPNVPANDTLESSYVRSHAVDLGRRYGVEANWEVLHGDPVEAMASFIGARRDILVVMATRGRSALQAAVLGSVTAGLLREGNVPIIVRMP